MAEEELKSLKYIPEVILKKRKSNEAWALRKKAQFERSNFKLNKANDSIKKPEDFVFEYRNKEVDFIRMKRRVKRKRAQVLLTPNTKPLLIIRIQGKRDMHPQTRKVLYSLGLRRVFSAVFVKPNEGIMEKLRRVEPYVTYGYPNLKSIKELIYKKGHGKIDKRKIPLTDNNIIEQVIMVLLDSQFGCDISSDFICDSSTFCYEELGNFGIVCIEDMVHQIDNVGPHFKEVVRFLWPLELSKPAEGLKGSKTLFKDGGDTGNRDDLINEIINKMN